MLDFPLWRRVFLWAVTLAFALIATLVTGLVVGLAPALRLIRTDLRGLMNEGARGSSGGPANSDVRRLCLKDCSGNGFASARTALFGSSPNAEAYVTA